MILVDSIGFREPMTNEKKSLGVDWGIVVKICIKIASGPLAPRNDKSGVAGMNAL